MKTRVRLFSSICIFVLLVAACQQKTSDLPEEQNTVSPAETAEVTAGEGDVEILKPGEQVTLELPEIFKGGVTFEVANGNKVESAIDLAAAEDQLLSLTTAEGIIWTLIIPPGAVDENVTISMTELRNIVSSEIGGIRTGVLLEPDGLEFNQPVTITMKGEGLGEVPLLFRGSHDGAELNFAQVELIDGGISASITHFSTMYGDPYEKEKIEMLRRMAGESYKEIRKVALKFLKTKISAPPPVPLPIGCPGDKDKAKQQDEALKLFERQFAAPEVELAQMLLETGRAESVLGGSNDSLELAKKVRERLVAKAMKLYKEYYPKEEYYFAITRVMLEYDRLYNLLGGESNLIPLVGEWAKKIIDKSIKAVREEHDYRLIPYLIQLDQEASSYGSSVETNISEINKVTRFKVVFEVETQAGEDTDFMITNTQGEAKYYLYSALGNEPFSTGQGKYTGFEHPAIEDGDVLLNSPEGFEFRTSIENFDPCKTGTMEVLISRFGHDLEVYQFIDDENNVIQESSLVQGVMWMAFEDQIVAPPANEEGFWFKFKAPIQNLNPTTGELALTQEATISIANLKIRIEHIPEK